MRNAAHVAARVVLGGYLVVHGAQKLFGAFGGPGLDTAAAGFDAVGLTPGKQMAALAGVSEVSGGLLTASGIAHPLGPIAIVGAMTAASAVHRKAGPLGANGGYELPLTNLAFATALAVAGPGPFHLGPPLSKRLTAAAFVGAATLTAVSVVKLLNGPAASPAVADEPASETSEPIANAS
ncbi:MAG: DoxX [Actinomycetia bacterium]|nr:DoxX [Actinomycetes bacterium]